MNLLYFNGYLIDAFIVSSIHRVFCSEYTRLCSVAMPKHVPLRLPIPLNVKYPNPTGCKWTTGSIVLLGLAFLFILQWYKPSIGIVDKGLKPIWIQAPNQEPALELHRRAAPSVEAHHHIKGPDTGRNSRGRRIIKKLLANNIYILLLDHHTKAFLEWMSKF